MSINLFPAILLAGSPNCGKSVLSFLLTKQLREAQIPHYLLRAVPDGEGDWFLEGENLSLVRHLRSQHKTSYDDNFVQHMVQVIKNRALPLLVDIGGCPRENQFDILRACTHYILLYRAEEDRLHWQQILAEMHLLPVAELRSSLNSDDSIEQLAPILHATISGLEREPAKRKTGKTFEVLLERIAGICSYDEGQLEQLHLSRAPFHALTERQLADQVGLSAPDTNPYWKPEHLADLHQMRALKTPCALYGRGPVWLAAMLAVHTLPAPMAIFDIRYGWITLPEIGSGKSENMRIVTHPVDQDVEWMEILLPKAVLELDDLLAPEITGNGGLVLSGKLPRWAFAALARYFAPRRAWIGVDDPKKDRAIIVHSQFPSIHVGDVITRPTLH